MIGSAGDNLLEGHDGNDSLKGNAGNDTLAGQLGNDTINGGDHSDRLTGGAGADTFDYVAGYTGGGKDTITDFTDADEILIRFYGPSAGGSVVDFDDLTLVFKPGGTLVEGPGIGQIWVPGVQLNASDFRFADIFA